MEKRNKKTDAQQAAIQAAQNFLSSIPAGAPETVLSCARARVTALGGKVPKAPKAVKPAPAPAPAPPPAPMPAPPAPPAPLAPTIDPFALEHAKALVAESEALVLAARKAELVERLRSVRAQLAVKKPALAVLVSKVRQRDADGEALDHNIAWRRERIALLQSDRSDVFDYLPSDPEAVAWRIEVERLESEIRKIMAAGGALPYPEVLKLEYVTLQAAVQQLEWNERSILNQLSNLQGRKFATWGGKDVSDAAVLHMPF